MKVFLDMVGCRLNQSELENYARQFRMAGLRLTSDVNAADLVVINTCTVTSAAASDSRQKIRQAARGGSGRLIVTGCWATLNPGEALQIPGVTQVVANPDKDNLVPLVLDLPVEGFFNQTVRRQPIPGSRLRTRAFIKVQDGCDNHCTYCITRLARGSGKSRPVGAVLQDIQSALEGGAREIVLTGVHLGSWGYDFASPSHLSALLNTVLADTDTPRLRLSSLEPWDIAPEFFELWQDPRLCRHLHLPLQSGSQATLNRMGRRITAGSFSRLVQAARATIPGVAITTDVITGFPGECQAEFSESSAFVKEMEFAGGHVFTYSARSGAPAASLPDQVPNAIARERNARMRAIVQDSSTTYMARHLGCKIQVLWEKAVPVSAGQWELSGLSDNYLRLRANSSVPCYNQLMDVHITGMRNGALVGEIVKD